MPPDDTPTTEAGRALVEEWYPEGGDGLDAAELRDFRTAILAIERQARDRALTDALAAVTFVQMTAPDSWLTNPGHDWLVSLAAVRDAVEALRAKGGLMKQISSTEFQKTYQRLTEPHEVTVHGHPIAHYFPIGTNSPLRGTPTTVEPRLARKK